MLVGEVGRVVDCKLGEVISDEGDMGDKGDNGDVGDLNGGLMDDFWLSLLSLDLSIEPVRDEEPLGVFDKLKGNRNLCLLEPCDLLLSLHCKINWTSFEYSPHFIKIFSGFSSGVSCLSLFLHRSVKVNRPDLPVAWAKANTTS